MSIGTPAFFWSLFGWDIFFQPFTFSLYVSLVLRRVSCRQHTYIGVLFLYPFSLSLSFGWGIQPIYV